MTRDFASNSKKRSSATRFRESNKESNTNFVVMILCLVLGIVITLVAVYFYQNSPDEIPQQQAVQEPEKPSAKNRYKAVPAEEVEESEFKFHQELRDKTVDVEVEEEPVTESDTNKSYIMQCGSFRTRAQAETQKAKVAMTGFQATINITQSKTGKNQYRVHLGPYKSKRKADQDSRTLLSNADIICAVWPI